MKSILLRTASGGEMQHYSEKKITFAGSNDGDVTGVTFQVTDVKKPLLAVRRLAERGSSVSFGPSPEDNCIINKRTGVVIPMEKRGGSFAIRPQILRVPQRRRQGRQGLEQQGRKRRRL